MLQAKTGPGDRGTTCFIDLSHDLRDGQATLSCGPAGLWQQIIPTKGLWN
jgi:hypothetical protein